MNWAMIENGIVINVIWAAGKVFDNLVPTEGRNLGIGDVYRNGRFYRVAEGEEVEILTPIEQRDKEHTEEMAALIDEIFEQDVEEIFGSFQTNPVT